MRRGQRHYSRRTCILKTLAQHWVSLNIREYDKAFGRQTLGSFQCLHRVGEEIARVGMDFEFDEIGAESLAGKFGRQYGLFGIPYT